MSSKQTGFPRIGRFIWGLDLLRETLEAQRKTNLRLEKERQTLIASVSHNIKSPVSAIKLYAAALDNNLYESEGKRRECAQRIGQNAETIEKLVGDVIATSTSSLSEVSVNNGEFYLSELVEKIITGSKEKLELLKIRFTVGSYQDKLLLGDLDKLAEAVENMIENAIKYGDGKNISISFQEEDYRQLVRIENSGKPVPQNELPHIFSSFWRGSNAEGKPGNWLGLYICKQLLRKMDGDLYAEAGKHAMAFVMVLKF